MGAARRYLWPLATLPLFAAVACSSDPANAAESNNHAPAVAGVCTGVWPSYWQDPAFDKVGMWQGQQVSNTAAARHYTKPAFQLADAFAAGKPDDPAAQKWRDPRFAAMFNPATKPADKATLAHDYAWEVMRYLQDGNTSSGDVNTDWNLCANTKRQWFNMPFQTYDVLSGREFVHGLTREAPVTFSVASQPKALGTTVWAVAFYNGNAAPTMNKVWHADGTASVPTQSLAFDEGTVIGKLLFTTATPANMPFLKNLPVWTANISMGKPTASNPTYCAADGMSMPDQSKVCTRSLGKVTLLQFDVAVEDSRSPIGWVYGTFVADGEAHAAEKNPWDRISLLGLMWGNDTPPVGTLASTYPTSPRTNGFPHEVIAWDVVDRLNKAGGTDVTKQPGHLGCNARLNGPADNINSSCISCHMTASVPDKNEIEPPILAQFSPTPLTPQCAAKGASPSGQKNGVTFPQMDAIYFAVTHSATPVNMNVGGKSILGPGVPLYADGSTTWKAADFSLQMSTALAEWMEWQRQKGPTLMASQAGTPKGAAAAKQAPRVFRALLPRRDLP